MEVESWGGREENASGTAIVCNKQATCCSMGHDWKHVSENAHSKSRTSLSQRTRGTGFMTQCFSTDYVSCNTDVSTNNAVCILASAPSPYLCWTCIVWHVRTVHTRIPTPANGRYIPDYRIFADKCEEDTWGMEEWQEGAEERKELTGTSFQYQRVGHCQKKKKGKEIERQGNEDWEDNRSTDTTRGKSSSVWWTKIPVKPEEVESGLSFSR